MSTLARLEQWTATPPNSSGVLHVAPTDAPWEKPAMASGGMDAGGGYRARCGAVTLPLWRTVTDDEVQQRGTCAACMEVS